MLTLPHLIVVVRRRNISHPLPTPRPPLFPRVLLLYAPQVLLLRLSPLIQHDEIDGVIRFCVGVV